MLNRKGDDINLEDLDYIKNIESVNRYMSYGVSGYSDSQEKVLHYKCLQNKFIESQNKIEDNLNIIETVADNHAPNRKKGDLFNRKDPKNFPRNAKRRSKKLIKLITFYFF